MKKAVETENDPETSLLEHDSYVEKSLSEINGIKTEDVDRVREYFFKWN